MPLLDIATAQPSLQSQLIPLRSQTFIHGQVLPNPWKSSQLPTRVNFHVGHLETLSKGGKLQIRAVATTLEPKCLVPKEDGNKESLGGDSSPSSTQLESMKFKVEDEEPDEREKLRRMRISKANKGNTPWNKGRKHSAETLQRIRERTKLAMQNPKVKMKLVNLGHSQSEETRAKIGIGVRMGWERRREKLMVQETCHFEWMNLIAEASRKGYSGEGELQWDSYKIKNEQLTKEWLESVEERKNMPKPKGSKRAPKSPEQRRKIAEAIAAKWADPDYRERVCSGLAKYHGIPAGTERKPKRKPTGGTVSGSTRPKQSPSKRKASDVKYSSASETISPIERIRLRRKNKPLFKDPMASSKLEMIKNIRAQRAAEDSKKTEVVERARLLIAEAEKAAKALEVAAMKSPVARASLLETRKLISEAIQSIESIEGGQVMSDEDGAEPVSKVENITLSEISGLNQAEQKQVNGNQILSLSNEQFNLPDFMRPRIVNGVDHDEELTSLSSNNYSLSTLNFESLINKSDLSKQVDPLEINGVIKHEKSPLLNGTKVQLMDDAVPSKPVAVTKKWVRGKLVEVSEEAS
ncbi:Intron-encoded nuclease 2 [Corchorus capsularis]|uniref:Intron-encoded nuclease 2 n=1 Tax=Corchorus capsularis TaxID=210143 RepID=A0A1R3HJU9_COCAP|nr:Intron-encoded nuclease 2 [Corchorus capsularis]